MSKHLYLLLAGHSGVFRFDGKTHYLTAGKRSPQIPPGIYEGEFNREVCTSIDAMHDIDTLFINPGVDNMTQKRRVEIVNDIHKRTNKKCVLIAIHANAAGVKWWSSANGFAIFHSKNASTKSRALAKQLEYQLRVEAERKSRGIIEKNFNVLHHTKPPAVLVECEFMTNLEGAKLMASPRGPQLFANNITDAIVEFDSTY